MYKVNFEIDFTISDKSTSGCMAYIRSYRLVLITIRIIADFHTSRSRTLKQRATAQERAAGWGDIS